MISHGEVINPENYDGPAVPLHLPDNGLADLHEKMGMEGSAWIAYADVYINICLYIYISPILIYHDNIS